MCCFPSSSVGGVLSVTIIVWGFNSLAEWMVTRFCSNEAILDGAFPTHPFACFQNFFFMCLCMWIWVCWRAWISHQIWCDFHVIYSQRKNNHSFQKDLYCCHSPRYRFLSIFLKWYLMKHANAFDFAAFIDVSLIQWMVERWLSWSSTISWNQKRHSRSWKRKWKSSILFSLFIFVSINS